MKGFVSYTPVISDGQTQGTPGMRYSLVSRDLIADCIETMYEGYLSDAIVTLAGCDKTNPGVLMPSADTAMVRNATAVVWPDESSRGTKPTSRRNRAARPNDSDVASFRAVTVRTN